MQAKVEEVCLYEAAVPAEIPVPALEEIRKGNMDIITFTSSSTVSNFTEIAGKEHINHIDSNTKIACIGPVTAGTARKCGFSVDFEAETYTVDGLIEALTKN
jgi:uroporphyrinogen-III synthase